MSRSKKNNARATGAASLAVGVVGVARIHPRTVTDASVLDRGEVLVEAFRQTRAIADAGSANIHKITKTISNGSARPHGISLETAKRYATQSRPIESLSHGANPLGKLAEVVVSKDYKALHAGRNPAMVNPPKQVAMNLHDFRLATDPASGKDFLVAFEAPNGDIIWKYSGQAKTGDPAYVAKTLIKMAKTSGRGTTGYVDARYVNIDGSPRVATDAFTTKQAHKLIESKVELRGIPNLDARAEQLMADLKTANSGGLDPVAKRRLEQLRDDIGSAYSRRGTATRIVGGAATAAVAAAVVSLIVQMATDGKIEARTVSQAGATGALFGGASAAADSGLYHFGSRVLGMAPEAAKSFAQNGVSVGFCALAIGTDMFSEIGAWKQSEQSGADTTAGVAMKIALDLLPLVLAPLGLLGLPIIVGSQVGGRWLIAKAREANRDIECAYLENKSSAANLEMRLHQLQKHVDAIHDESDATDAIFRRVMNASNTIAEPTLRLISN